MSAQSVPGTRKSEYSLQQSYTKIIHQAEEFLDAVYKLGYSGEAGERDTAYLVQELNKLINTPSEETANAWRVLVDWQIETGSADM